MKPVRGTITSAACIDCHILKRKCKDCIKASNRERQARFRKKQKDSVKQTRANVAQKGSKYKHILCDKCLDKNIKDICKKCVQRYQQEKSNNYKKRRKFDVENKAIIGTNSQPKKTDSRKVESIYVKYLCTTCKPKSIKEICRKCKTKYTSAKSIKSKKKQKCQWRS